MNKRIVILFACLSIFVVLVVLGAAVFIVRSIDVTAPIDSGIDKAKIISDSKIIYNTNIFTVSEKTAISNIELANPYIKVKDIERVFPNSIVIDVVTRHAIIAVPLTDGVNVALLDVDMKILNVVSLSEAKGVAVVQSFTLPSISADNIGEFLDLKSQGLMQIKLMKETVVAMESYGYIKDRLCAFVSSIDLGRNDFMVMQTTLGAKLCIRMNTNLTAKDQFKAVYSALCNATDKSSGYIYINSLGVCIDDELPLLNT